MENLVQPNIIIFRLPDADDGTKNFVEVTIRADGSLSDEAISFTVHDEDSFNDLEFSTLVLGRKDEDELGAYELASFLITDSEGQPAVLYEVMGSIDDVLPRLLDSYNTAPSIQ